MNGTLLIISGPSGVGKSTICARLAGELNAFLSISATTRPQRGGEVAGKTYRYLTREEFEARLEAGEFLEYAQVYGGNYYGTPAGPVREALASGRAVILEIDIAGTQQVVRLHPDAISVYILPPTKVDLRKRLLGRGRDTDDAMRERLSKAEAEIAQARGCGAYRHFVINDDVDETVRTIAGIVRSRSPGAT